jgi:hypothetical protein
MGSHRFKVGDRVLIVRSASASRAEAFVGHVTPVRTSAVWTVTRLLPLDGGGPQYHVRAEDGAQRSVHESELTRA